MASKTNNGSIQSWSYKLSEQSPWCFDVNAISFSACMRDAAMFCFFVYLYWHQILFSAISSASIWLRPGSFYQFLISFFVCFIVFGSFFVYQASHYCARRLRSLRSTMFFLLHLWKKKEASTRSFSKASAYNLLYGKFCHAFVILNISRIADANLEWFFKTFLCNVWGSSYHWFSGHLIAYAEKTIAFGF